MRVFLDKPLDITADPHRMATATRRTTWTSDVILDPSFGATARPPTVTDLTFQMVGEQRPLWRTTHAIRPRRSEFGQSRCMAVANHGLTT